MKEVLWLLLLSGIVLITLHDIIFLILPPPLINIIVAELGDEIKKKFVIRNYIVCYLCKINKNAYNQPILSGVEN